MLYYILALFAAAALLFAVGRRNEASRWAAFFLSAGALGGAAELLLQADGLGPGWNVPAIAAGISYANLVLTPYAVLIFCLVYTSMLPHGKRRLQIKLLLLLPALLMIPATRFTPALSISYWWLLAWAAPYYLSACWLLVRSAWKERRAEIKRQRLITALIMAPTLLAVFALIYVGRAINPEFAFFNYVAGFILYSFCVAGLCIFGFGVLGIRLRVERQSLEHAMETAGLGAAMLNHTIKNEAGKVALNADLLLRTLPPDNGFAREQLGIMKQSAQQLLAMAARIHGQTKEMAWRAERCRLDLLAAEAVDALTGQAGWADRKIGLQLRILCRPVITADPAHIRAAIANLLDNAVDAMPSGGTVEVVLEAGKRRRWAVLSVEDSGVGVGADVLGKVFEPFFSTKHKAGNYGLGLSYVYKVMQAAGGAVELGPRAGGGARAELRFPYKQRKDGHANEPDSSIDRGG